MSRFPGFPGFSGFHPFPEFPGMGGGRSGDGYDAGPGGHRELTGLELGRQGDAISNQVSLVPSPTNSRGTL